MITISRTSADDPHFVSLVTSLDEDLAIRDGEDHDFYHQFNSIKDIKYAVIAFIGETAVGCGAIKEMDDNAMEVKRMYTLPSHRGNGIASLVLKELEVWARELGFRSCKLETGKQQPEALALYTKKGYKIISNYGQYKGVVNSICFEKELRS